jgi:hypothetical protein
MVRKQNSKTYDVTTKIYFKKYPSTQAVSFKNFLNYQQGSWQKVKSEKTLSSVTPC